MPNQSIVSNVSLRTNQHSDFLYGVYPIARSDSRFGIEIPPALNVDDQVVDFFTAGSLVPPNRLEARFDVFPEPVQDTGMPNTVPVDRFLGPEMRERVAVAHTTASTFEVSKAPWRRSTAWLEAQNILLELGLSRWSDVEQVGCMDEGGAFDLIMFTILVDSEDDVASTIVTVEREFLKRLSRKLHNQLAFTVVVG